MHRSKAKAPSVKNVQAITAHIIIRTFLVIPAKLKKSLALKARLLYLFDRALCRNSCFHNLFIFFICCLIFGIFIAETEIDILEVF